jgi:hypothetical protein
MTPELKRIGNKLFEKVELTSHKIDLALVDDFNKDYQKLNDVFFKVETNVVDYNELANKIASDFNSVGQVLLSANKKFEDVLKSAKDLGIDLPAQIKNQGEALKLYAKDIDYYVTKLKGNKIALRNG